MKRGFKLIFAVSLLLMLLGSCTGSSVGVCYGRNADDLPTPDKASQLAQIHKIKYVKIYDSNIQVLKAFANTGIELMISIPNTDLLPQIPNMFDSQIDAIYFSLMALNFKTIKVMVTETGWPSKGSPIYYAQTYNTNLIRHVINNTGTPAKPGAERDVYIFSLFNENRKPGLESERNWGLFYPDQTSVYNIDFNGKGSVDMTPETNVTSSNGTWCIASSTASEDDLKNAINWACNSGNVDCSAIQPSQPCYEPDSLESHASFAFNSYYQQNGATDIACRFGGSGVKTNKNPSYDKCLYMTAGSNKTAANNVPAKQTTSYSTHDEVSMLGFSCLLMISISFF